MSISIVCGIDIGAEGAIAFMQADGTLLGISDLPIDKVQDGKFQRSRIAEHRLLDMLADWKDVHAFIEIPEARPIFGRNRATGKRENRQPSAKNMLSFGMMYGTVKTACIASGFAVTEVKPGAWKRVMSLPGDKDECRRLATQQFPKFAGQFARVRDDGRAESAFLALYGKRQLFNTK